ncbi:MAG TPA: hypothetical protein VFV95_06740, partial [Vicinamibacterales bacterium]|nr:hypothetical protein [Vicinamibacterales bacterium]
MSVPGSTVSILDRLRELTELLETLAADRRLLDELPATERERLHRALADLQNPDPVNRRVQLKALNRARRAARARRDDRMLDATGIRALRRKPAITTPNVFPPRGFDPQDVPSGDADAGRSGEASMPAAHAFESRVAAEPQNCYTCKEFYTTIHHFYDQLCPSCADLNLAKRTELADLRGRVALLTGGRVKIGYQAGLKLLRCGAQLIVTTRFPRDAAMRYALEPD